VVCNLIDAERDVITLMTPSVPYGPFSITLDVSFDGLAVGQPANADAVQLVVGDLTVGLGDAPIWEPYPEGKPTFMARLARGKEAYSRLILEGLGGERHDSLLEGVKLLAGLGPGGTPAGDDFLVGVMAAIWLLGDEAQAPAIAETAAPRTSALSAAFLRAAGRGELIAPWHALLAALSAGDVVEVEKAAMQVESFGASSGADALDGFILAGRTLLDQPVTGQEQVERWKTLSLKEIYTHDRADRRNHQPP
jgi:hypothetical protein